MHLEPLIITAVSQKFIMKTPPRVSGLFRSCDLRAPRLRPTRPFACERSDRRTVPRVRPRSTVQRLIGPAGALRPFALRLRSLPLACARFVALCARPCAPLPVAGPAFSSEPRFAFDSADACLRARPPLGPVFRSRSLALARARGARCARCAFARAPGASRLPARSARALCARVRWSHVWPSACVPLWTA